MVDFLKSSHIYKLCTFLAMECLCYVLVYIVLCNLYLFLYFYQHSTLHQEFQHMLLCIQLSTWYSYAAHICLDSILKDIRYMAQIHNSQGDAFLYKRKSICINHYKLPTVPNRLSPGKHVFWSFFCLECVFFTLSAWY